MNHVEDGLQLMEDIIFIATEQGSPFSGPEIKEARACHFGVRYAYEAGIKRFIVEGDCLPLINLLKRRLTLDKFVGFVVTDILSTTDCFDFCSLSLVKRG